MNIDELMERLKQAIAHHDQFNSFGDDHALFLCPNDGALFELPYDGGQVTMADLRALTAQLTEARESERAAIARAEERGVRMGIEAAAKRAASQTDYTTVTPFVHRDRLLHEVRALAPAAIIRANALSELAAADAVLLDLPEGDA